MDEEHRIRDEMRRLRRQIGGDDSSEIFVWIIPNMLACSQRPLRDDPKYGGRKPLPSEAKSLVVTWVERIKQAGIRSIICMLEDAQLEKYYERGGLNIHEQGLLGYYKSKGFHVRHFPQTDYQPPSKEAKQEIYRAFSELPKPVLLHCSAAIDRTPPVAAFIAQEKEK